MMIGKDGRLKIKGGKWILLAVAALGAIALMARTSGREAPKSKAPKGESTPVVSTVLPREDVYLDTMEAVSTLEALEDSVISPKVTARIVRMSAKPGQRVRKGQVLALLDYRSQEAQVSASYSQLKASQSAVLQAKASLDDAAREVGRYEKLFKEGYATRQELDKRKTAFEQARASYQQALANAGASESALSAQRINRQDYVITAPMDGVVLDDYDMAPGTLASPSTPLFRVANLTALKGTVKLPEAELRYLKEGMEAKVVSEALGDGRVFKGRLSVIYPYVDTSTRTVKAQVLIQDPKDLKPGMLARVTFIKGSKEGLVIPSDAVRDGTVMVLEDGRVKAVKVKLGKDREGYVMVTEGLTGKDRVIAPYPEDLSAGDKALEQGDKKN
ncbi:MAG: efflux RND transporter periplasmic adaptor subunit [Thermanaerothrix sp.]|nr:efflux RND transporter periplasmic adaptor subunit [Thermanaerothrix sp.]